MTCLRQFEEVRTTSKSCHLLVDEDERLNASITDESVASRSLVKLAQNASARLAELLVEDSKLVCIFSGCISPSVNVIPCLLEELVLGE